MAKLEELQAAVAAEDSVIDSAIVLIQGLAEQIANLPADQAAIDALAADVRSRGDMLSQAVVAGTPAAKASSSGVGIDPNNNPNNATQRNAAQAQAQSQGKKS